ncbi:hypothetical protein KRR38_20665 [Novosphingobium sp. G106]|uniref:hypothetical protein n=1 Tax=Novosphingobium sp. G106 TaxID=2849500 RepID=UPI001C2D5EC0|nr:hypothetical protein [Novosphingobium sp. G106]MBV1690031.1 hypothetical protein [Novosphingobium sp. G106]
MTVVRRRRASLWLEYAFIGGILSGLAYSAWFLFKYHYLPQPWFYEPWGTFMDWYSLVVWGHEPGAYDIAGTIYPPLSFIILRIFSKPSCYPQFESEWARDCDHIGIYALLGMVLVNAILTFLTFRKHDRETYIPRAFALSFGFPMIFAFERGNLLLFTYPAVLLGFGPLLRSARLRWFFGGVALNFKIYLIGAVFAPLLRRKWSQTEGMLLFGAAVYIVTWLFLGEGSPSQIVRNVTTYVGGFGAGGFLDLWYAGSFIPAISLLKGETFPITTILDSNVVDILLIVVTGYLRTTQLLIVLAAVAAWLRPEAVPLHRMVFLAITLALSSSEAGGYTQLLVLIFVFMEPWRGVGRPIALLVAYLLCLPAEYVIFDIAPMVRTSWLWDGGARVITQYGVGAASLLRLVGNYLIIICLACVTLRDIWTDIRQQGWRGRWRYRDDAPILPLVEHPIPAAATSNDS